MNNTPENQELDADKKRRLIQNYLHKLMDIYPQMYYSPTSEIAREIHLMIKEHTNRMPIDEQALFRKLTVRDVEMILSFH